MSSFNPNDQLEGGGGNSSTPIDNLTTVVDIVNDNILGPNNQIEHDESSFGDNRKDTGVDTAGVAEDIGAVIGSVGGSLAGVFVGLLGGPIGIGVGAWVGGMIGAGLGTWVAGAIADVLDNDDATVWNSLSPQEKDNLIQALLIEALVGLLPIGIGKLVTRGAAGLSASAMRLYDKLAGVVGKVPAGAAGRWTTEVGKMVVDNTIAGKFFKHFASVPESVQREVLKEMGEAARDVAASKASDIATDKVLSQAGKEGLDVDQMLARVAEIENQFKQLKEYNLEAFIKNIANSPAGIAMLEEWSKKRATANLLGSLGVSGFLKGAAVATQDTQSLNRAKSGKFSPTLNMGGIVMPEMPMPTAGLLATHPQRMKITKRSGRGLLG